MAQAVEVILLEQDLNAGGKNIGFQYRDDSTSQTGSWEPAKTQTRRIQRVPTPIVRDRNARARARFSPL